MPKRLRLTFESHDWIAEQDGARISLSGVDSSVVAHDEGDGRYRVGSGGESLSGIAAMSGDVVWVSIDQQIFEIRVGSANARSGARAQDALTPPMSATVVRISVKVGDHVKQGDPLIVLEAMKMELPIRAPHDGTVGAINCREGELVQPGTVLVELGSGLVS